MEKRLFFLSPAAKPARTGRIAPKLWNLPNIFSLTDKRKRLFAARNQRLLRSPALAMVVSAPLTIPYNTPDLTRPHRNLAQFQRQ